MKSTRTQQQAEAVNCLHRFFADTVQKVMDPHDYSEWLRELIDDYVKRELTPKDWYE